jgi:septum formation protein
VRLLLASRSPRRAGLLAAAGFAFEVVPADVDEERRPGEDPDAYVARVARAKAEVPACRDSGSVVLGADTAVVVDGAILGKPADERDAVRMLETLSGRAHDVLTGVALRCGSRWASEVARTRVRFLPLEAGEIAWYVGTGEPYGKAGGYAIQGRASRFIDRIEGSYSNVVGLPVDTVYRLLRVIGWRETGAR